MFTAVDHESGSLEQVPLCAGHHLPGMEPTLRAGRLARSDDASSRRVGAESGADL